ncbi:MAG: hypothetical protein AABZ02_03560 [Bacteroidota bacterium]
MNNVDHREPAAFGRLLVRSAILGLLVPITQGDFWEGKAIQVAFALVICLLLYGLEKAVLWPFRKRQSIRPLYSAAYRGALVYSLLILARSGDIAEALGAGIGGALFAMLLFAIENWAIKLLGRGKSTVTAQETASEK